MHDLELGVAGPFRRGVKAGDDLVGYRLAILEKEDVVRLAHCFFPLTPARIIGTRTQRRGCRAGCGHRASMTMKFAGIRIDVTSVFVGSPRVAPGNAPVCQQEQEPSQEPGTE